MALTKVRGGAIDNPLTLGGGSASDNSIIFDGNAQDFHIGLDDSTDSLTIGLGSTLGTTSHMVIDATGAITKPLQPAFSAKATTTLNFAVTTTHTMAFGTEIFDQNNDFSSNTFTAPVTGKYQLNGLFYFGEVNTDSNWLVVNLITSNREYYAIIDPASSDQDQTYLTMTINVLADMDANDTAHVTYYASGGTAQIDVNQHTYFSGYLVA